MMLLNYFWRMIDGWKVLRLISLGAIARGTILNNQIIPNRPHLNNRNLLIVDIFARRRRKLKQTPTGKPLIPHGHFYRDLHFSSGQIFYWHKSVFKILFMSYYKIYTFPKIVKPREYLTSDTPYSPQNNLRFHNWDTKNFEIISSSLQVIMKLIPKI